MHNFIPATSSTLTFFLVIVLAVLIAILCGAYTIDRNFFKKVGLFLAIWLGLTSAIVLSDLPRQYPIPVAPILLVANLLCAIGIGLSPWGGKFASLPAWMLIAFQSFRFPLEIVLHMWAKTGTVPQTMTFTGQNYDIISGLLAILVVFPAFRSSKFLKIVNLIGIILLANVMRVVIMSSPFPFAWDLDRPIQLIFFMPYALIGFVCVWAAILGHVIATRSLIKSTGQ